MKVFILFLLSFVLVNAQKVEEKTITNGSIQTIVVEGDALFKIDVKTTETNSISIVTKTEGEYAQNTIVFTDTRKDSLIISTVNQTIFKNPNDKLSAHKVLSIELFLEIPKNLNLYCKSSIASSQIAGTYKQLIVELHQGNIGLLNFSGDAIINTFNGNIMLETNTATINAKTKTGNLVSEKIEPSESKIEIHSIHGNINIYKTKK
ncbi:hypothetical protein [Lacinutrix chionoecetis]